MGHRCAHTDISATMWLLVLSLLVMMNGIATGYRVAKEHRVHNIMLYPEKHSWCKPTPIKQVVENPGCRPIEMENNVCVGACFSFFVPRTIPETPGDDLLYYCDSCQPNSFSWTTVTLECPDNPAQPTLLKNVEVIANCTCLAVQGGKRPLLAAAGSDASADSPGAIGDESRESFSGEDEDDLSSLETSNHVQSAEYQDVVLLHAGGIVLANKTAASSSGNLHHHPATGAAAASADNNASARERYLKLGEPNPDDLILQAIDDEEDGDEDGEEEEMDIVTSRT